jgi:acyl-coenzyme A thioesterase PaaI-like protein
MTKSAPIAEAGDTAYEIEEPVPYANAQTGTNPYLDYTLNLQRGCEPVRFYPRPEFSSGDGYMHFSVVATIAEEAAWQCLEEPHAVPAQISINLLRPAHVLNGPICGFGQQVRKGANTFVAQGSAVQGGKTICLVTVTFVRFEKR